MWDLLRKSILLQIIYAIASVTSSPPHFVQSRTRIVNGEDAEQSNFKYQVSIQVNGGHICGGAIIADQYILTAAHCFFNNGDMSPYDGDFKIVSGTTDLSGPRFVNEIEYVVAYRDYVTIHSRADRHQKDIAVVKLKNKLNLDDYYMQKINLPVEHLAWPYGGNIVTIAGYGYTEDAHIYFDGNETKIVGSLSQKLKTIQTQVIDQAQCQMQNAIEINEKHICTYKERPENDENLYGECYGDSGSPLTFGNTVLGIVSAGAPICGTRNIATIYTRVSYYLDFIRNALNDSPSGDMVIYTKSDEDGQYHWK